MTRLHQKIVESKLSLTGIANAAGVRVQDVSHYIRGNKDRVGKGRRKRITEWMIQEGFLDRPKPREMCICPLCNSKHVKRKLRPNCRIDDTKAIL